MEYSDDIKLHERFCLKGHRAFITGSARGIGRAIALGLAEYGAQVIVHGVRESEKLSTALESVRKLSPSSFAVTGDLSDPEAPAKIAEQIKAKSELPDIFVANASMQFRTPWSQIPLSESLTQMQVNFHSTLLLAQLFYPVMKAQKWGRIVTIGSVQEFRPHPEMAVYAASKSAQENLVRNIGRQVACEGITVNNIAPGVFATDRNDEALSNPVYAKRVTDCIPSHTYAEPADAAGAALLLCSDAGRYITGANIVVDGGLRLPG